MRGIGGIDYQGARETFCGRQMNVHYLGYGNDSQVYTYVKINQTAPFTYGQFIVCQLYPNEAVNKFQC